MWNLWCGSVSPLFGKDKMAFFEQYYFDDKSLHAESYNSCNKPFVSKLSGQTPNIRTVEKLPRRANIWDTDKGSELLEQIADLKELLTAYKNGSIKEPEKNILCSWRIIFLNGNTL